MITNTAMFRGAICYVMIVQNHVLNVCWRVRLYYVLNVKVISSLIMILVVLLVLMVIHRILMMREISLVVKKDNMEALQMVLRNVSHVYIHVLCVLMRIPVHNVQIYIPSMKILNHVLIVL
jgi:hypothetical protein